MTEFNRYTDSNSLRTFFDFHLFLSDAENQMAKLYDLYPKSGGPYLWVPLAEQLCTGLGWQAETPVIVTEPASWQELLKVLAQRFVLEPEPDGHIRVICRHMGDWFRLHFDASGLALSFDELKQQLLSDPFLASKCCSSLHDLVPAQPQMGANPLFTQQVQRINKEWLQQSLKKGQDNAAVDIAIQIEMGRGFSKECPITVSGHDELYFYLSQFYCGLNRQLLLEHDPCPLDEMQLWFGDELIQGSLFFLHSAPQQSWLNLEQMQKE